MMAQPTNKGQLEKFKQAARELETDDDPKCFEEWVGELAKQTPVPAKMG